MSADKDYKIQMYTIDVCRFWAFEVVKPSQQLIFSGAI